MWSGFGTRQGYSRVDVVVIADKPKALRDPFVTIRVSGEPERIDQPADDLRGRDPRNDVVELVSCCASDLRRERAYECRVALLLVCSSVLVAEPMSRLIPYFGGTEISHRMI